jgi:KDO2-lipid IV(A) lauroyltransferase
MGRQHDGGGLPAGVRRARHRPAPPRGGAGRDRAVGPAGRGPARPRAEEVVRRLLIGLALTWGRLPAPAASRLGRGLGDLAFLLLARRRRLALDNLRLALPDLPEGERRRIARRSFQHLGLVARELCALLAHPVEEFLDRVRVEGREHLDAVMAGHGRALAVSAHLGNWELLALAHRVTPYRLAVVVRPLDSAALDGVVERLRLKTGVQLIAKRRALREVLRELGAGAIVGILLDQNAARAEGVFVPFFGRPASTSRSVALLAVRTRTPIVPIFARREPDGAHAVVIHPALVPGAGQGAVQELTERCTAAIERAVRAHPDQWLWLHDRWRTRPARPS